MKKSRLEAFSDGVIAIIITIMVLELKTPHNASLEALIPMLPVFLSYILSFIYVGIYWNNHHHMIYAVESINGKVLWANLNLLFWLSLIPFVTAWMGETHFSRWPVMTYGVVLLMNSIAYYILARLLVQHLGKHSALALALGRDRKGKASTGIYIIAIAASFVLSWVSLALYALVALIWLVPDKRIEKHLGKTNREANPE